MWRQLVGLDKLQPHVLAWRYFDTDRYPLGNIPIKLLDAFEPDPENQSSRWLYRARCLPQINFYGSVGKEKKEIEKWLSDVKPSVILAQFGFTGLRILPIAKKMRIPVVVHFHGLDLSSSLNNRWYRWSILKKLHDFSAIVVVGSHQKQWVLDHGISEDKIHVIPCGVPTDQFLLKDYATPSGNIKFITVSRLERIKALDLTIRAFENVLSSGVKAKLTIVGDGMEKASLERYVEGNNLKAHVSFSGALPPAEVVNMLRDSDVFLQHSTVREGSPVSVAEASSVGLPVVSTICGGIPGIVKDGKTGFLVEQKDVEAMAEKMLILAKDPDLRKKMGQAGRQRMMECYDTKKQIAKLEEVLLRCAKYK